MFVRSIRRTTNWTATIYAVSFSSMPSIYCHRSSFVVHSLWLICSSIKLGIADDHRYYTGVDIQRRVLVGYRALFALHRTLQMYRVCPKIKLALQDDDKPISTGSLRVGNVNNATRGSTSSCRFRTESSLGNFRWCHIPKRVWRRH